MKFPATPKPVSPGVVSPKAADPKPVAAQDFLLDPLPVPDATESNTDTAWGLWEYTLQSRENGEAPTQAAELQDFPETVQSELLANAGKVPKA